MSGNQATECLGTEEIYHSNCQNLYNWVVISTKMQGNCDSRKKSLPLNKCKISFFSGKFLLKRRMGLSWLKKYIKFQWSVGLNSWKKVRDFYCRMLELPVCAEWVSSFLLDTPADKVEFFTNTQEGLNWTCSPWEPIVNPQLLKQLAVYNFRKIYPKGQSFILHLK